MGLQKTHTFCISMIRMCLVWQINGNNHFYVYDMTCHSNWSLPLSLHLSEIHPQEDSNTVQSDRMVMTKAPVRLPTDFHVTYMFLIDFCRHYLMKEKYIIIHSKLFYYVVLFHMIFQTASQTILLVTNTTGIRVSPAWILMWPSSPSRDLRDFPHVWQV